MRTILLAAFVLGRRSLARLARRHGPDVRAVRAQCGDVQQEIRAAFDRNVQEYEAGGRLELPVSVKLAPWGASAALGTPYEWGVARAGIEPATPRFSAVCSTN